MFGEPVRVEDDPVIFAEMDARVIARLRQDQPVVVDATNVLPAARLRMIRWADEYDRPTTALRFLVEDAVLLSRNQSRTGHRKLAVAEILRYAAMMRTDATPEQLRSEGIGLVIDVPSHDGNLADPAVLVRFTGG
jgi:predicted kinase